jgi:hypothetical protein
MKTLTAVILLAFSQSALADLGNPSSTVEAVIRHAQKGQIVGVNLNAASQGGKQEVCRDALLKLLRGIDPEKLVFQAKDEKHRIYWFVDPFNQNKSVVRILEPKRLIFEVSFVHDSSHGCGGYHEITSIREAKAAADAGNKPEEN